jgi:hypothetical protein
MVFQIIAMPIVKDWLSFGEWLSEDRNEKILELIGLVSFNKS